MNHKVLSILAICFLIFSCKNEEKKETEKTQANEESAIRKMIIQLDVIQKTDDNYAIYFTEDNSINFSPENTIWSEVKSSPETQTLNFYFPESVHPTHVRFDLGNKPEREDLVLNKFKIVYGDRSLDVRGSDFFNFFHKNDSIVTEIDQANGSIKFLKKPGSKVIPFFYPNDVLVKEMAKLLQ